MHILDVLDILDNLDLLDIHRLAMQGEEGSISFGPPPCECYRRETGKKHRSSAKGGEKDAQCYYSKISSNTCVLNTLVMRGEAEGSINLRPPPFEG